MIFPAVAFTVALAGSHSAWAGSNAPCRRYERDSLEFRGQVVRRVYPGRPNYESVRRGDAPDTVYVLRLAMPICMAESDLGLARKDVRELQRYFSREDESAIRGMNGQTVQIPGTLEEWRYGWHHLPVLLHVRGLHRSAPARRAV